ncbi:MAG: chemotaxis protein CheW [Planctomycetales bacterium]|nr:chemotaxis protein CheW [Planctomycetales bacterium]
MRTNSSQKSYCTFKIGELVFGVEVLDVQEVIREQQMTSVPLASSEIRGLMNLRGQIVTAIDLRERLKLPSQNERAAMNVVVRASDGAVSLLVDEIGDVIEVSEDQFELPPETLDGVPRDLIRGTYKLDDYLLLVLDTGRVLDTAA